MKEPEEIEYVAKKKRRLRAIWNDHHEAIIVGMVGFATNIITGYVGMKVVNGRAIKRTYVDVCPSVPEGAFPEEAYGFPLDVTIQLRNGSHIYRHLSPTRPSPKLSSIQPQAISAPPAAAPDLSVVE